MTVTSKHSNLPDHLIRSKKQKILLFFSDYQWHLAADLVAKFGWSWNQRKNIDLSGKGGIEFISQMVDHCPFVWKYIMITPANLIDFEKCIKIPRPAIQTGTPGFQLSLLK